MTVDRLRAIHAAETADAYARGWLDGAVVTLCAFVVIGLLLLVVWSSLP